MGQTKWLDEFPNAPENFDKDDGGGLANRDRAKRASAGLREYWGKQPKDESETIAKDFLTDLMHWCDGHGIDFYALVSSAAEMHSEEQP